MPADDAILIRRADWHLDRSALRRLRDTVFVQEQAVPLHEEWDEFDTVAIHFLAEHAGEPVACGRLQASGKIGRLAVLPAYRGQGVGGQLLRYIVDHALADGQRGIYLHAQSQAIGFYTRCGFAAEGEEFLEAGIRHHLMRYRPVGNA